MSERTFPVCSLMLAASIRREGELMSEEALGRGLSKGQVGGRCPPKYQTDQPILSVPGLGVGALHSSTSPTLTLYAAVVEAETT